MRGTAKGKVVTSGRLTGGGRVQLSRRRTPSNPGAAVRAEPAYSLYSTDSEDQVTTLHRGLDRCAALLGGMLQAEKAEPLPGLPKGKLRPPQKQAPTLQLRPPTPPIQPQTSTPPPQPQTSIPPPQPPTPPPQTAIPPPQPPTPPPQTSVPPPPPQTSVPPLQSDPQAASEAPPTSCLSDCDVEEEECVPVRDTDTHTAVRQTHTCSVEMPNTQMETGHVAMVTEDTRVGERKMVQNLLEELKALITGQAERLLSHLEQSLSSQQMDVGGPVQTAVVQNQNCQLRRRVRILNQQLKEREKAALHSMEPLNNSAVCSLQEQLDGAQSRLQELQDELTGVRKDLRDTQSQLRDREEENSLLTAATTGRERKLVLQSLESTKACFLPQQQRQQPPPERITHFLLSLGQPVSAERGDNSVPLRDTSSHPDVTLTDQSLCPHEVQAGGWGLLSHADGSVCSDLSSRSGSTLDSRAEAAFRDGLAALDASIASLQRTFQLDLGGAR
ncbi:Coiled-coil domain containing protein 14 [Dissostichus eleginoides]|uniref:Coiled-coil domain containing protein 14 n=1 Tax=Dissostichus eleginoides TaxID=100907 RepID=A0AAD9B5V0_DISEL|nr:Coiled-coil domain containing protein 14 [Dissostichus eleginoides]